MFKNLTILATLAIIIALPFIFRRSEQAGDWRNGDPVLIIISPHNEAIRYEFEHAFSAWHAARHKRPDGSPQPVKIDWRNVGGTTEIARYLQSQFDTSAKVWWTNQGNAWPAAASDATNGVTGSKSPADTAVLKVFNAYRSVDDATKITSGVDLFFGGGQFDHFGSFQRGFAVAPWTAASPPPPDVAESLAMIPETAGGEVWRTPTLFGNAISTFGIIYNLDRLRDLNITSPPTTWDDLADYRYFHQVGVTDPTKSGSIAKAFEMLVHQKMHDAARAYLRSTGVADDQGEATIAANEKRISAYKAEKGKAYQRGDVPDDLKGYQAALEQGWFSGLGLIQSIGANARYFTDSATKVSIDVSIGDAAVGMTIDFYGRFQAQSAKAPDGSERMKFVTPAGGTSVSCDPISLLRGAPHRELAAEFIGFVISADGQKLWTYAPGAKNDAGVMVGNEKYALRRLPIRRDFYPSTQPAIEAAHIEHKQYAVDDLADPNIDPYQLAKQFTYYSRWTGDHFNFLRDIARAMCMDSADELTDAWQAIHPTGTGGSASSAVDAAQLTKLHQLPTTVLHRKDNGAAESVAINWRNAPDLRQNYDSMECARVWTEFFRNNYRSVASGTTPTNAVANTTGAH